MIVISRFIQRNGLLGILKNAFAEQKYPFNINREEHTNYLKKVEKAKQQLTENQLRSVVPRRKRRLYDKPKHDLDLTNYVAWRIYDPEEMLHKFWAHGAPVATKLYLQPKWVLHAFGIGLLPVNHQKSSTLQFSFEDNNFSKFLLYEYRNTTAFTPNIPNYDYNNQNHLPERRRKKLRLSPEQFWQSEQHFEFRLNCSAYAEKFKFKKWVEQTVEQSKSKESYDDFITKKYGPQINYNKKSEAVHFEPSTPAILHLTPLHFNIPKKGEKLKEPQVELPKKIGEEYRILPQKTIKQDQLKVEEVSDSK